MKKIIVFIFLLLHMFNITTYASEINVDKFMNDIKEYSQDILPELQDEDLLDKIISGNAFDKKDILNRILNNFLSEIKNNMSIIFTIIAVSILCSVLKNIQSSFGGNVSEVSFYVCYLFIVILIISSYTDIVSVCRDTIVKLNDFMNVLIPLILALLVANGNLVSVGMMQPVLLIMISVINILVSSIILPIIFISTMMNLISNISENIDVSKIPKLLQKTCVWCLEFILIIFVGILSLEGTLAANVDGITAKTTKTIVSTVIPVVGKALSEATDSVIGAASITKNAIGIIGIIVIVGIVAVPLIKVFVMMLVYNISSALIQPIVDKRISNCMTSLGDSIKIIFGLMATVSMLFIISTTIIIKVGNFSLMYR